MKWIAGLAAAVLMSALLPAQTDTRGAKLLQSDARRLVADIFGGDAKRAETARRTLEATRPEDRKLIANALRTLPFAPPKSPKLPADRTFRGALDVSQSPLKKGNFVITLPKVYDGRKPLPVLFRFHGSGSTAASFADNTPESKQPFICVTPEIPSAERIAWNEPGGYQLVDQLFHKVLSEFTADPDHVYLFGYSAGGA